MIEGMSKRDIPPRDRKFYCFNGSKVVGYDYLCTVDTIHINVTLPYKFIAELIERYQPKPRARGNGYNAYMIRQEGITLMIYGCIDGLPAMCSIQLQRKITVEGLFPPLWLQLRDFLSSECVTHYVRRIDIAFDFVVPFKRSIFVSRVTSLLRKNYLYGLTIGSTKSKSKTVTICHYDREKRKGEKFKYANRAEVRMHFYKKQDMQINNLDHDLIIEYLKRELLVVDFVNSEKMTAEEKQLLCRYKNPGNENLFKDSKPLYRKIREKVKNARQPLEDMYMDNQSKLFDFLTPQPIQVEEQTLSENRRDIDIIFDLTYAFDCDEQKQGMIVKNIFLDLSLSDYRIPRIIKCWKELVLSVRIIVPQKVLRRIMKMYNLLLVRNKKQILGVIPLRN